MRTVTEERTPKQQTLYDRIAPKMTSASAFGFAAHSYDAVMVLASAIKQANSTNGSKIREALENLHPLRGPRPHATIPSPIHMLGRFRRPEAERLGTMRCERWYRRWIGYPDEAPQG
jgi:hypothetical protein